MFMNLLTSDFSLQQSGGAMRSKLTLILQLPPDKISNDCSNQSDFVNLKTKPAQYVRP